MREEEEDHKSVQEDKVAAVKGRLLHLVRHGLLGSPTYRLYLGAYSMLSLPWPCF